MKTQLSAVDVYYLVKEFSYLSGGKISQIYHPEKKELLFVIHVPSKGKSMLKIKVPNYIHLTDQKDLMVNPSGFCMFLRKYLSGSRIETIEQVGFERIIRFVFDTKDGKRHLYVELFSKGNVILCDSDGVILSPLERQSWKDRSVKSKEQYVHPKKDVNTLCLNEKDLRGVLSASSKESLVKSLAIDIGLGGVYAEEVCLRSDVDKNAAPGSVDGSDVTRIVDSVKSLFEGEIAPLLVLGDGKLEDVVPFPLQVYDGCETRQGEAFNVVLCEFFLQQVVKKKPSSEIKLDRMRKIVAEQEEAVLEMEEKEIKERSFAEAIYSYYRELQDLLTGLNNAAKKHSWQEIKAKLKGHTMIKEVNPKEKSVIVELED